MTLDTKRCVTCAEVRPLQDFSKLHRSADGRRDECSPCRTATRRVIRSADYDALFVTQMGRCAICHIDAVSYNRRFSVDHDHENGEVRALLCSSCNTILGMAGDQVEILRSAIGYLLHHQTKIVYDSQPKGDQNEQVGVTQEG